MGKVAAFFLLHKAKRVASQEKNTQTATWISSVSNANKIWRYVEGATGANDSDLTTKYY